MTAGVASIGAASRFLSWRMVGIAFLAQNFATGLTFGSFGTIVLAIEEWLETSRTLASLGIALVVLALGLMFPLIGAILNRVSIKRLMIAGALICAAGYLALAYVSNIRALLLIYALVIGPGVCLLGVLPACTLVSNWFVRDQGKALGIVNMPLFVMLVPMVTARIVTNYGLQAVFLTIAATHLLVLPALLFVIDRPEDIGQSARGAKVECSAAADAGETLGTRRILGQAVFWLMSLGLGIIVGGGTMKVAHLVPLMSEQGWGLQEASLLLAISGGTGIVGAIAFGWLADRIGPGATLASNAFVQAVVWLILLQPVGFPLLVLDAVIIGACGGGVMGPQGVMFTRLFGAASFPRAMGLTGLLTLPFVFGTTPVAGYLHDLTGSYALPFSLQIMAFLLAGAIFLVLTATHPRLRGASQN